MRVLFVHGKSLLVETRAALEWMNSCKRTEFALAWVGLTVRQQQETPSPQQ